MDQFFAAVASSAVCGQDLGKSHAGRGVLPVHYSLQRLDVSAGYVKSPSDLVRLTSVYRLIREHTGTFGNKYFAIILKGGYRYE
jgi:hypothetical protein